MVLGLLASKFHYEQTYYTEIAKRARLYHNVVAQFTPFCIDPKTDLISGLIYDTDTGKWKEQTFPIPSYIYDRYSFHEETDFEKAKSIKYLPQGKSRAYRMMKFTCTITGS